MRPGAERGNGVIGLLQRVASASVTVAGESVAGIGPGLLVLAGVEQGDTDADAQRLAERLLGYRIFEDAEGRMNRSVLDTGGGVLLVPQFTLAADTRKGARPSFSTAATPELGRARFDTLARCVTARSGEVGLGRFGARMQVSLTNDGPVTFLLRVGPSGAPGHAPG